MSFSIVIPTSNRPRVLARLLHSLTQQHYKGSFEVHVVENGPKPISKAVVARFKNKLKITYTHSIPLSSSLARNIGIQKATKQYILCLDDDVTVQPELLAAYHEAWKHSPDCQLLGGGILVTREDHQPLTPTQQQLLTRHQWCFAHQPIPLEDQEVKSSDLLFSANLSFRRSAQLKFTLNLGTQLHQAIWLRGEDFELCFRTSLQGGKIKKLADPRIAVTHWVSAARFTPTYIKHRYALAGIEILIMEKELAKLPVPKSDFLYLPRAFGSFSTTWQTLFNPYERTLFLSYLMNRAIFS